MQVLLALPAYNEEKSLPAVLQAFHREMQSAGWNGRVVVVDDGSTDQTGATAQQWTPELPVEVLRHEKNLGLGQTLQDALRRAAELAGPDDIVVTMDADNTHSPSLIREMIQRIQAGCDVVIASRFRPGARVLGLSAWRRLLSYGGRLVFQLTFPIPGVRDYTCSFRAYRARVLRQAFARYAGRLVREKGFSSAAEILLNLWAMGVKIGEVPLTLHYERKEGPSKMRVARTVLMTLRLVLRRRLPSSGCR